MRHRNESFMEMTHLIMTPCEDKKVRIVRLISILFVQNIDPTFPKAFLTLT